MTLLITVFAAVIATAVWYKNAPEDEFKVSILCWMYWGASIMWFVDAVFEYFELREQYFTPALQDMINDAFLGLSVAALGLVVWIVALLVKDPRGVVRKTLFKKTSSSAE